VFDKSGNIWFTAQNANYVGHVVTRTGEIHLIKSPTAGSRPYGIVVDPKNRPWFVEFGTNKIAMIDAATMKIVEHNLPDSKTHPRRIAVTSDGILWYGDYTRGMLGRFDPSTGAVKEWPLPSAGMSLPYAMTSDDKDRIWLVETGVQPNRLVGFDPRSSRLHRYRRAEEALFVTWCSIVQAARYGLEPMPIPSAVQTFLSATHILAPSTSLSALEEARAGRCRA
jgi:virginiamycin B lyase